MQEKQDGSVGRTGLTVEDRQAIYGHGVVTHRFLDIHRRTGRACHDERCKCGKRKVNEESPGHQRLSPLQHRLDRSITVAKLRTHGWSSQCLRASGGTPNVWDGRDRSGV